MTLLHSALFYLAQLIGVTSIKDRILARIMVHVSRMNWKKSEERWTVGIRNVRPELRKTGTSELLFHPVE